VEKWAGDRAMTDGGASRGTVEAERLRTLIEPSTTALLVQELQNGVVGPSSLLPALADAVRETNSLHAASAVTRAARAAGVSVIHCTAENLPDGFGANSNARIFAAARRRGVENRPISDAVHPVADLFEATDYVLPRFHGLSPLTGTHLDSLLRNNGTKSLVVIGVSINLAVTNLVMDAVNRSYQVVLVSDAVVGVPVEYGREVVRHTLSLIATVVTSGQLEEAWRVAP
jgi:nicotinamidase-related amidase